MPDKETLVRHALVKRMMQSPALAERTEPIKMQSPATAERQGPDDFRGQRVLDAVAIDKMRYDLNKGDSPWPMAEPKVSRLGFYEKEAADAVMKMKNKARK